MTIWTIVGLCLLAPFVTFSVVWFGVYAYYRSKRAAQRKG